MYKSHEGEVHESVQDVIRWQFLFFWLWYALCRPSDLNSDSAEEVRGGYGGGERPGPPTWLGMIWRRRDLSLSLEVHTGTCVHSPLTGVLCIDLE